MSDGRERRDERADIDRRLDAWRRADRALDALLELPDAERTAALQAMALEPAVAERVRRLLEADSGGDGPLDAGLTGWLGGQAGATNDGPTTLAGRRVGPFEIEREIGRGGMSVVYLARRADASGYEQKVALKILTFAATVAAGERVDRETSILAGLRHPNIAALIDAGAEPDGTRWMAMEWIEGGMTITEHREARALDARAVVTLFLEVCDAVAYAHRNLVVHRDLKPSNVLVDAAGHARLLDFGIAKMLDEAVDESVEGVDADPSRRTRMLTPAYAAPEQLEGGAVTTATDVYGLGGILRRLLPDPDRDLQAVVDRCLRPEPERRYANALELREDLVRWLERRPVRAMRDRASYRLRKWVERHRTLVVSGLALVVTLLAGLAATAWQAQKARDEALRAAAEARRAAAVTDFVVDLFELADPDRSAGESLTVREALDAGARRLAGGGLDGELVEEPAVRAELLGTIGEIYRRLGLYDEAAPLLEATRGVDGLAPSVRTRAAIRRALLAVDRNKIQAAEAELDTALATDDPTRRAEALEALGHLRVAEGRFDDAVAAYDQALALRGPDSANDLEAVARLRLAQAEAVAGAKAPERAGGLHDTALAAAREAHTGDHTQVAAALHARGAFALQQGDAESARRDLEAALAMRRRLLGDDHPDVAFTLAWLSQVHRAAGRVDEAEASLRRALELQTERLVGDHPAVLTTLNSLALLDLDRGRLEEAATELEEVLARSRRAYGVDHPDVAVVLSNLAAVERSLSRLESAESHLLEAAEILRASTGEETLDMAHVYGLLGNVERMRGDLEAAERETRRALAATLAAIDDEVHPAVVALRINLGGIAFERGQMEASIDEFRDALRGADALFPDDHPMRNVVRARFARSLERAGRADEAVSLAERGAAAAASLYPPDHRRRLEAEAILGGVLRAAGRVEEGERWMRAVEERLAAGAKAPAAADEVARWRDSL